MNVRPGVPYLNPPAPHFSGHGYSELVASGLEFKITGKQVDIKMPKSIPQAERQEMLERFKQIGFDGISIVETVFNKETDTIEFRIVVE